MNKKKVFKDRDEDLKAYKNILNADDKTYDAYIYGKYGERIERRHATKPSKVLGIKVYKRAVKRLSENKYS